MFFVKQKLNIVQAKKLQINGNSMEEFAKKVAKAYNKESLANTITKVLKSSKSPIAVGAMAAAAVGGIIKLNLLKLNRISTKQYKPEITSDMDKKEVKVAKLRSKKQKRNANFRNFTSGAINGLTTPVLAAFGVVGAPIYAAVNSLTRYFVGSRTDRKHKNLEGYVENLKSSPITHIATAAAIAVPAVKSAKFNKVFDANLNKVVENIKNNELVQTLNSKTSYSQLEDAILGNDKIKEIIESDTLTVTEKIEALTDENIFAVKFKQICSDGDDLTVALKESCPSSRTLDEAKAVVAKTYGDAYTIKNRVGVGTVAETYIATDKNGNEVAIKMIKEGITEEKILNDKQKFLDMIDSLADKTPEEKTFLKANVENIADGVLAEVNLTNEMESAKKLAGVTTKAKLVKPITVKDNVYVMEKADGVSLQTFINTSKLEQDKKFTKWEIDYYTKNLEANPEDEHYQKYLAKANEKLNEIEEQLAKQPPELSKDEAKKLYETYQDVLVEQFSKVDKGGKIIHGDIHPGNIFIDVDALKRGDKQFLTLIDTGNTITQSSESALRFLNLTKYVNDGDVDNIAAFVLEGAKLPAGMTLEKAQEQVSKALSDVLFDNKTHIGPMSNDSMLAITDGIMQKLSIIPSDTQGNLLKSKASSEKSLDAFFESFAQSLGNKLEDSLGDIAEKSSDELSKADMAKMAGKASVAMAELGATAAKMPAKKALQEKINLKNLTPADRVKLKRSPNAPKKNSEEYLNYIVKQGKKTKDKTAGILEDMF